MSDSKQYKVTIVEMPKGDIEEEKIAALEEDLKFQKDLVDLHEHEGTDYHPPVSGELEGLEEHGASAAAAEEARLAAATHTTSTPALDEARERKKEREEAEAARAEAARAEEDGKTEKTKEMSLEPVSPDTVSPVTEERVADSAETDAETEKAIKMSLEPVSPVTEEIAAEAAAAAAAAAEGEERERATRRAAAVAAAKAVEEETQSAQGVSMADGGDTQLGSAAEAVLQKPQVDDGSGTRFDPTLEPTEEVGGPAQVAIEQAKAKAAVRLAAKQAKTAKRAGWQLGITPSEEPGKKWNLGISPKQTTEGEQAKPGGGYSKRRKSIRKPRKSIRKPRKSIRKPRKSIRKIKKRKSIRKIKKRKSSKRY